MEVGQYTGATASMIASRISSNGDTRLASLLLLCYRHSLLKWCARQRTESPIYRIEWDSTLAIPRDVKFPVNISAKRAVCMKIVSHSIHVLEHLRLILNIIQVLVAWLEYLQKKFSTPMVCLWKREKILLDNHMVPELTDFGLWRLFHPGDETYVSMFRVVGTHNHLLLEYAPARWRKVTKYDSTVSSARSFQTHNCCDVTVLKSYHSRSPCDAEFSVTTPARGGIDIKICSRTIHAPRYLSVHHPLIQMVLFARKRTADIFTWPKSMVPKSTIDMVERSCSSASSNVYGTGFVSAKSQPESPKVIRASEFNHVKTTDGSIHLSLPVVFGISTKKTSSNVSSTPIGSSIGVTVDVTELKMSSAKLGAYVATLNMEKAPAATDSVEFGIDSSGSVSLSCPVASLHQQLVLNSVGVEHSDKPRSNGAPAITSSVDTTSSLALPKVRGADRYVAKPKSESPNARKVSEFYPGKPIGSSNGPSLPIHSDTSLGKETDSTVSSTRRFGEYAFMLDSGSSIGVTADGTQQRLSSAQCSACVQSSDISGADSVEFGIDSDSSVLAPVTCLHKQHVLNSPGEEGSDKPRGNGTPAITSSAETTRFPTEHKHTDSESQHNSDPVSGDGERGAFKEGNSPDNPWIIATGASHHVTGNRELLTGFVPERGDGLFVHAADGTRMPVAGRGNVDTGDVRLPDVWHVPGLRKNLVSVSQLAELDYSVEFSRGLCFVRSAAGVVVGRAHAGEDGLYEVDSLMVPLP